MFRDSTHYEYADRERTIVRRTRVDHPANLTELQTAIDEADARIAVLPEPKSYPTQKEYKDAWADTGKTYEEVCAITDKDNTDDPDVQERIELETVIKPRLEQEIIDWRAKVDAGSQL